MEPQSPIVRLKSWGPEGMQALSSTLKSVSAFSPPRKRRNTHTLPQDLHGEECVQVFVRVRPFDKREMDLHAIGKGNDGGLRSVVDMPGAGRVLLLGHSSEAAVDDDEADARVMDDEEFHFTKAFWSIPESQQKLESGNLSPGSQEDVYEATGKLALDHALEGYNACILAYGQTGSGKTYTVLGDYRTTSDGNWIGHPGIMPRFCRDIFEQTKKLSLQNSSFSFELRISAIEIYNETVRDLFWMHYPGRTKTTALKIRVHPTEGPFVDQLTVITPNNWRECTRLIATGVHERTTAVTWMNEESSRSHCILMIHVLRIERADNKKSILNRRESRVSLVDLAGCERNKKSGAQGMHLREAAGINQSLLTLKKVIDALVMNSKSKNKIIVPYRESALTYLLSTSLGGNSKTAMIACVSPHIDNREETMLTLRYVNRAKGIVNHVQINMNDSHRAAELRSQLTQLHQQLALAEPEEVEALKDQIEVGQKALDDMKRQMQETDELVVQLDEMRNKEREARYAAAYFNAFKAISDQKLREENRREIAHLEAALRSEKDENKTLKMEMESIRRQMGETQSKIQTLDEMVAHQDHRVLQKIRRFDALFKGLNLHRTKVNVARYGERWRRIVEMKKAQQFRQEVRKTYTHEIQKGKDRETELRTAFEAQKESIKDLNFKNMELENKIEIMANDRKQAEHRAHSLNEQLLSLEKEKIRMKNNNELHMQELIEAHEKSMKQVRAEVEKVELRNSESQQFEFKKMKNDFTSQVEKLEREIAGLRSHEQELLKYKEDLSNLESTLHENFLARESEMKRSSEKLERLYQVTRNDLDIARSNVAELKSILEEVEDRERQYAQLANRIQNVYAQVAQNSQIQTLSAREVLDLLGDFANRYHSNAPDLSRFRVAQSIGRMRASPAPRVRGEMILPKTSFFPLLYPDEQGVSEHNQIDPKLDTMPELPLRSKSPKDKVKKKTTWRATTDRDATSIMSTLSPSIERPGTWTDKSPRSNAHAANIQPW